MKGNFGIIDGRSYGAGSSAEVKPQHSLFGATSEHSWSNSSISLRLCGAKPYLQSEGLNKYKEELMKSSLILSRTHMKYKNLHTELNKEF